MGWAWLRCHQAFGQVGQGQILPLWSPPRRITAGVGEVHGLGQLHAQMLFQPVDEAVELLHEGLTRGCIRAVTVEVNRWMAVFSPQPRQAPSPQFMEL
jgi:hypothetical protein